MRKSRSRSAVPHNGKLNPSIRSKHVYTSDVWGYDADFSSAPELPPFDPDEVIPERCDELNVNEITTLEKSIQFIAEYWSAPILTNQECLSDHEIAYELDRLLNEQIIIEILSSQQPYRSLQRIRSLQIDLELESGHQFSLDIICILIKLVENAKRNLEEYVFVDSIKDTLGNLSTLFQILPSLYQVREYTSFPSTLNTAEIVELANFLYEGGCFKKGVNIGKVRMALAQLFEITASESVLNVTSSNNKKDRSTENQLQLINRLKKNWDLKHYGGPQSKWM